MNDLINKGPNGVATGGTANPFLAYSDAVRSTSIVGKLLKFSKGDWMAGENNEIIHAGTQFVANIDELLVGWIRWEDMKPAEQIMGKVVEGYQPKRRADLGHTDKTLWDTDDRGEPRDPWQLTNYMLMQGTADNEEELYTFTTSSKGGLGSVGRLCRAVGEAQQRGKTGVFPVVEIGSDSYPHPNKSYGLIKYPTFKIVGWVDKGAFLQPDIDGAEEEAPAPKAKAPPVKPKAKGRF